MAVGGDLLEIKWQHPTLGSGVFFPKSNEDSTFDLGGFRSNDDANMIDGGANIIDQINRVRWSLETVVSWDQSIANELEVARQLSGSPVMTTFTITHISGSVWTATGKPVGDIQANGNQATFTLKLSGGSILRKV
jgi:hypothetical protein